MTPQEKYFHRVEELLERANNSEDLQLKDIEVILWKFTQIPHQFDIVEDVGRLTTCCLRYIDLVLKYSETLDDLSTRSCKKLMSEFMGVLSDIGRIASLKNTFVENITVPLMERIVDPSIKNECAKEIIRNFNNFIENSDKIFRENIVNSSSRIYLYKLADILTTCGDYEYQTGLLETIFRMCFKETISKYAYEIFPEMESLQWSLVKVDINNFDKGMRMFLNTVNKIYRNVFSIKVKNAFLDDVTINPPLMVDGNKEALWVDFNTVSETIGIYCSPFLSSSSLRSSESEDESWELITIFVNDVSHVGLCRNETKRGVLIEFNLKLPCHVLYISSEEAAKAKKLKLLVNDMETIKTLKNDILPLMFQNKYQSTKCNTPQMVTSSEDSYHTANSFTSKFAYKPLNTYFGTRALSSPYSDGKSMKSLSNILLGRDEEDSEQKVLPNTSPISKISNIQLYQNEDSTHPQDKLQRNMRHSAYFTARSDVEIEEYFMKQPVHVNENVIDLTESDQGSIILKDTEKVTNNDILSKNSAPNMSKLLSKKEINENRIFQAITNLNECDKETVKLKKKLISKSNSCNTLSKPSRSNSLRRSESVSDLNKFEMNVKTIEKLSGSINEILNKAKLTDSLLDDFHSRQQVNDKEDIKSSDDIVYSSSLEAKEEKFKIKLTLLKEKRVKRNSSVLISIPETSNEDTESILQTNEDYTNLQKCNQNLHVESIFPQQFPQLMPNESLQTTDNEHAENKPSANVGYKTIFQDSDMFKNSERTHSKQFIIVPGEIKTLQSDGKKSSSQKCDEEHTQLIDNKACENVPDTLSKTVDKKEQTIEKQIRDDHIFVISNYNITSKQCNQQSQDFDSPTINFSTEQELSGKQSYIKKVLQEKAIQKNEHFIEKTKFTDTAAPDIDCFNKQHILKEETKQKVIVEKIEQPVYSENKDEHLEKIVSNSEVVEGTQTKFVEYYNENSEENIEKISNYITKLLEEKSNEESNIKENAVLIEENKCNQVNEDDSDEHNLKENLRNNTDCTLITSKEENQSESNVKVVDNQTHQTQSNEENKLVVNKNCNEAEIKEMIPHNEVDHEDTHNLYTQLSEAIEGDENGTNKDKHIQLINYKQLEKEYNKSQARISEIENVENEENIDPRGNKKKTSNESGIRENVTATTNMEDSNDDDNDGNSKEFRKSTIKPKLKNLEVKLVKCDKIIQARTGHSMFENGENGENDEKFKPSVDTKTAQNKENTEKRQNSIRDIEDKLKEYENVSYIKRHRSKPKKQQNDAEPESFNKGVGHKSESGNARKRSKSKEKQNEIDLNVKQNKKDSTKDDSHKAKEVHRKSKKLQSDTETELSVDLNSKKINQKKPHKGDSTVDVDSSSSKDKTNKISHEKKRYSESKKRQNDTETESLLDLKQKQKHHKHTTKEIPGKVAPAKEVHTKSKNLQNDTEPESSINQESTHHEDFTTDVDSSNKHANIKDKIHKITLEKIGNSKPKKIQNDTDLNITQNQKRTRYEDINVDVGSSSKHHDTKDRIYKRTHKEKHRSKSKKRQSETETESSTDLNVTQGKQKNSHHEDFTVEVSITSTHQDIKHTDSKVNKPEIDLNTESSSFQVNTTQNKQFINETDYEDIMKILSRLKARSDTNDPNPKSPVHDTTLVREDKNNEDETLKELLMLTKKVCKLYDEHSVNKDAVENNVLKERNVISPNSFPHDDKSEEKKLPKRNERIIDDFPVHEKVSNQKTFEDKYILDTHKKEPKKKSRGRPRKRKLEIDETYSKNSSLKKQKIFRSKITKSKKSNLDKSHKLAEESQQVFSSFISSFLADVGTTNSTRLYKSNTLIEPPDTDNYNSMDSDVPLSFFPMKDDTVHKKKKSAYHKSNWLDDKELHGNKQDKTIKNKIIEKSKSRKFTPTKSGSSKVSLLPDLFIEKSFKIKDSPLFNSGSLSNTSAAVQKEVNNKAVPEKTVDTLKNDYTYDIEVRNADDYSNESMNSSEPLSKLRKLGKPALKSSINLDVFKDNVNTKTPEKPVGITKQVENGSVEGSKIVLNSNSDKIKILENICLRPPTTTIYEQVQDNISTASTSKIQDRVTQHSNDLIQSWICTGHPESYFPIRIFEELLSFFEKSLDILLDNLKGPIPTHLIEPLEKFRELAEVLHKRPSTK